jgi:hypothetical protein
VLLNLKGGEPLDRAGPWLAERLEQFGGHEYDYILGGEAEEGPCLIGVEPGREAPDVKRIVEFSSV